MQLLAEHDYKRLHQELLSYFVSCWCCAIVMSKPQTNAALALVAQLNCEKGQQKEHKATHCTSGRHCKLEFCRSNWLHAVNSLTAAMLDLPS